jgi:hypothetical protein
MNVEMREMPMTNKLPIFHLNEILALYLGENGRDHEDWWKFHLVSPVPLLKERGLW